MGARTSITMHVLGLAGGAFSMLFSFVWYLLADKRDKDPNPKLGTAVRSIHVIAFIYFIYLYQEAQSRAKDDVTNHCWGLTNQEMCEYWPCSVYYENPITNDGEFVHNDSEMPRYTCKWVSDHDSYQPYDSTEFIKKNLGKCIKDECALFQNATSVMTELCVLWLLLTYIVTYASNDLIVLSRKDLALVQCFPCGELVEDPNHENHQSLDEEDERHGEVEMLRAEVASLRDKVAHLWLNAARVCGKWRGKLQHGMGAFGETGLDVGVCAFGERWSLGWRGWWDTSCCRVNSCGCGREPD